jgi:hypothetical protein
MHPIRLTRRNGDKIGLLALFPVLQFSKLLVQVPEKARCLNLLFRGSLTFLQGSNYALYFFGHSCYCSSRREKGESARGSLWLWPSRQLVKF